MPETLAQDLMDRGRLNLSETFTDGTFIAAPKGALQSAKPSAARGTKLLAAADGYGLPLAVYTESAAPLCALNWSGKL